MSEERRFSLGEVLKNLLLPPRCFLCGRLLGWEEGLLCPACRAEESGLSVRCEEEIFGCDRLFWMADYTGLWREALERFKFRGQTAGQELFGELLVQIVRESTLREEADGIAFVPMPRPRERARGYNQARLLADYLAERCGLPVYGEVLRRQGLAETHGAASRQERFRSAESYLPGPGELPPGARVLLVDDIVTSGATLTACAGLLREKGAKTVCGIAPLRTPKTAGNPPEKHL